MKITIHQDVYVGVIMLVFSFFIYREALAMHPEASLFPRVIIPVFAAFALLIVFSGVKKSKGDTKKIQKDSNGNKEEKTLTLESLKVPLSVSLIVVFYLILIDLLGFFVATFIFAVGLMYFCQMRNFKRIIFFAITINLFVYVLFVMQLNLRLPRGYFF